MKHLLFTLITLISVIVGTWAHPHDNTTEASQTQPECPAYRQYNSSFLGFPQYAPDGEEAVPDGCACGEGLEDLNCGFCKEDVSCKSALNDSYVCRSDMMYAPTDTYKSYQCRLHGNPISSLVPNGRISVYADIEAQTAVMSVYNRGTINNRHELDCHMTGCQFTTSGDQMQCNTTVCACPDGCNSIVQSVIDMLSGKPAAMSAEPFIDEDDAAMTATQPQEHLVTIQMEGSPMDIQAICVASACSLELSEDVEVPITVADDAVAQPSEWKASASLSVVILSTLFALLVIVILCTVLPACCEKRRNPRQVNTYVPYDTDSETSGEIVRSRHTTTVLEFRNISRTVPLKGDAAKAHGSKSKTILQNISGSVQSGTLMGIMGPSGAGKSSLLNVLAAVDHTNGRARNSGQILLNGKVQKRGYRKKVAYVQQDDSLYETLTVRECVEYSALLRLPKSTTRSQKQAAVWKTLEELRLTHIATNRIGSSRGGLAGVSGGERKRVSIGMELVAQPSVIFLDEPSSGLDACAANQILTVLSELAHRNRIVILSIHQPSMRSFLSMDQILLLGAGQVMYNGSPQDVQKHLESKAFPCPVVDTVADHMLNVVSDKDNHCVLLKDSQQMKCNALTESTNNQDDDSLGDMLKSERRSVLNELRVLFDRNSKDIFRNRELFVMQMGLSILLACFVGAIFNDVTNDLAGFQNRMGAFYFSLSFFAFASFSSMDIFIKERHIFVRETGSKYHRAITYFLSKVTLDMFVLRVIPVSVFVSIFYWLMGLKNEPEAFVVFWATLVLFNMCAGMMSICISIATPTVGQANLIASVWFLIMLLFGGFLVNVQTMAPWYAWLTKLSIFYYTFELLMTNELTGLMLSFDAPGYPSIPIYGEVFLETIGMHADRQAFDLICLCCLIIGFGVLAYVLLLVRVPPSAGKHFQRMHNENKRLPPPDESISEANFDREETPPSDFNDDDETPSDLNDDEASPPETATMLDHGTDSKKCTVTVLSAGSASSFWSCISPTSSWEKDTEYVHELA